MVFDIADIPVNNDGNIFLIAGPCVIESEEHTLKIARELKEITDRQNVSLVFKSSFDKANRTSIESYRGPGLERGREILGRVRDEVGVPVITDFHTPDQAESLAEVVDALQVPAFLCRQTDMLIAAGETGLPINVKKGQFVDPENTDHIVEKVASTGNDRAMLCERGAQFGYGNLVVDMRNLEIMKETGQPVVFDATHSVQRPGAGDGETAGDRRFAPALARAALAVGVAGLFMEVHDDPPSAKSDSATQLYLDDVEEKIEQYKQIDAAVKNG